MAAVAGCGSAPKASFAAPNATAIGFCQDMSVHHEQAILMSQLALTHGTPAIQGIATSILSSQSEEVGAMRGWLVLWKQPAADPHPMEWMMPGMSMSMPGMATPLQTVALYQRHGKAFDLLFLQLMIRHHLGGVDMARYAIADHASAPVLDAARQMIAGQVEEIGTMRALLAADGGKELAPPTM